MRGHTIELLETPKLLDDNLLEKPAGAPPWDGENQEILQWAISSEASKGSKPSTRNVQRPVVVG
jgi:hypothetical protein